MCASESRNRFNSESICPDPPFRSGTPEQRHPNSSGRALPCKRSPKRNVNHWVVEFGVLRDLVQEGWTETTLKPGDWIKVAIHAKSDGDHSGVLVGDITYADGKALSQKPPGAPRFAGRLGIGNGDR